MNLIKEEEAIVKRPIFINKILYEKIFLNNN